MDRFSEELIIKVLWKLGHVLILNLIMVTTSSVNESKKQVRAAHRYVNYAKSRIFQS